MTEPTKMPNSLATGNGSYYVGMTKVEAEKNGNYKNFIGIDFKDLDKNKDGVLSQEEVLFGIKNEAGREALFGAVKGAASMGLVIVGAVATGPVGLVAGLLGAGGCALAGRDMYKARLQSEEAQNQLDQIM